MKQFRHCKTNSIQDIGLTLMQGVEIKILSQLCKLQKLQEKMKTHLKRK